MRTADILAYIGDAENARTENSAPECQRWWWRQWWSRRSSRCSETVSDGDPASGGLRETRDLGVVTYSSPLGGRRATLGVRRGTGVDAVSTEPGGRITGGVQRRADVVLSSSGSDGSATGQTPPTPSPLPGNAVSVLCFTDVLIVPFLREFFPLGAV